MPNDCMTKTLFIGDPKKIEQMKTDLADGDVYDLTLIMPMPEILNGTSTGSYTEESEARSEQAYAETGCRTWHEWQYKNWGTKWGPYDMDIDQEYVEGGLTTLILRYSTAWGPLADTFYEALSGKYGIMILAVYDEPNMMFAGAGLWINGRTVSSDAKDYHELLPHWVDRIGPDAPEGQDWDYEELWHDVHEWMDQEEDSLFGVGFAEIRR
jgi:hypothetical protein